MNGTTSVAPMRGCSPVWCVEIDLLAAPSRMPANAASTACSTGATKVMTVRLCDWSDETSRIGDAVDGGDGVADRGDDLGAAAFGEIRNALDELHGERR